MSVVGGAVVVTAGATVVVVDVLALAGLVVVVVVAAGAVVVLTGRVVEGEVAGVVVVVGSMGRIWAPAPGARTPIADARVAATRTPRRT